MGLITKMRESMGQSFELMMERVGFVHKKSWEKLWATALENRMFQDKVMKPYEQIPSVFKAVKAIADNVPQAEIIFRDWTTQEESAKPTAKDLQALFDRPNEDQSQNDFIQEVVGIYALYGEVIILKVTSQGEMAGTSKLPAGLIAFPPDEFTPVKDNETGLVAYWKKGNKEYPKDRIIQIKDFNPYDKSRGLRPLKPLEKVIDIDWLSLVFNKSFFDNDATPQTALATEKSLTEVQRKRLQEWWEQRHKGADNAFKMAILEAGLEVKTIGASHKDMDFIEQKRFTREEILGTWRSPKALFNITDDLNYSIFQGQMKVFWLYAILPILSKIADGFNRHLVSQFDKSIYLEFDLRNVPAFQEDLKDKVATAKDFFLMGVPLNAINEKLDLGFDEYEWGDDWWIPFGLHPADEPIDFGTPAAGDEGANEDTGKTASTRLDPVRYRAWKMFLTKHTPTEARFSKTIRRYFYEQRQRVLTAFYDANKSYSAKDNAAPIGVVIDWDREVKELIRKATPYIYAAINDGVDIGKGFAGIDIDLEKIKAKVSGSTAMRVKRFKFVTETMSKRLSGTINDGIKEGETMEQIADRIRREYNMAGNRSMMIARTETTGAMNDGSMLYYKEAGVQKVQWVTAGDESVRETHRAQDGQVIEIGHTFKNGLRYPGDETAELAEVCNCRCNLAPAIEQKV